MANQPLVLVLDAQTGPLKSALKDSATSLADYGKSAQAIMQEIQDAMQTDLANGAEDMAKRMTKSLQQQISLSRRLAQSSLDQGQDYNPLGAANSASSIAAAEAQERLAKSFREQAIAAAASTSADESVALGLRQVAVASELSAQEADKQALALRKQAAVFAAIEAEMGVAADEGATRVVGSHNRMSVSSMLLMHSVRSAGDSFAAGLPLTTIFAEQIGRVGEAAELSQGAMGSFGALMSGPWGLAIMGGVTLLGLLVKSLSESSGEAEHAANAHETLAEKLNLAKHSYDEIIDTMREYNHEQERSRTLALDEARALKEKTDALLKSAIVRRQEMAAALESKRLPVGGNGEAASASANAQQANEARELEKRIADNSTKIQELQSTSQNAGAQVATEMAKIATDPKYAIEDRFKRLRNEAVASIRDVNQLAARLADLTRQQKAAEDALKPAKEVRGSSRAARKGPIDRTPGNDSAYDAEYDRLAEQQDQVRRQGVTDPAELARLEKEHLDDARQRARDDILSKARRNDWSKADTDALLLKEDAIVDAQKAAVDAKLKADLAKQDQEKQIKQLEMADRLLQLQEQLAPTLAARISIQQQILANEKKIALLKANGDPAATAQVNQEYGLKGQIQDKANADPVTKYLDQIKQQSGDANAALKNVEADGLKGLTDGLVGLASGTESVSSAFKRMADSIIADLARIAIEKMISGLFGNLGGGGGSGGGGASIGSLVGGGSIDTAALGFADGGPIFGPGGPREDKIPIWASNGEFMVNAKATRKNLALLHAINEDRVPRFADGGLVGADVNYPRLPSAASLRSGAGNGAPLTFDLRGAVMTEDLLKQMNQISARHSASVLMAAPDLTQRNLADAQRMRIPS